MLAGSSMICLKLRHSIVPFLGAVLAMSTMLAGADTRTDETRWVPSPDAIQTPYLNGVPHTDAQGRPRIGFDPAISFMPIGLYHGLTGNFEGVEYSFEPISNAGFNTVVVWGGFETDDVLDGAEQFGLQVIISLPRDDEVRTALDHLHVLGFDIDHEPSEGKTPSVVLERLAAFQERRSEIRAIDPDRTVFTVDFPVIHDARVEGWEAWRQVGDVTAFWNYPIAGDLMPSIGGPFGVGETVARAVDAVGAGKPVWFVAQAFEGPVFKYDWRMPTPAQARAMSYAALVRGATGLIWFSYDSFVTRNGKVIGISPAPLPDHEIVLDNALTGTTPLVADAAQLETSRTLWDAVVGLNREFSNQRELWLSPTADLEYEVEIHGARNSRVPVLTQLKQTRDGLYLVAVNVDENSVGYRVSPEYALVDLKKIAGNGSAELLDGRIHGKLDGFGAIVLKLTPTGR